MNANHHFEIGSTHTVCQDYSTAECVEGNCAYAIVADGCSGSPEVDIGARLLALSAKRTLFIGGENMNYDLFGKITIRNLDHIGDTIPLNPQSLDATLLAAWVTSDNKFVAHLYGDGVFIHKTDTTLRIVHINFESGWPAYLSYYLDTTRLKDYNDKVIGLKKVLDVSIYRGDESSKIEIENFIKPFEPVTITGMASSGDIIAVASDGVNSFRNVDGVISWTEIVKEFVDFKTTEGVFVQRRLAAMKRKFVKENKNHYDDISMAAIIV